MGRTADSRQIIAYLIYTAVFIAPLSWFFLYVPLFPAAALALYRRAKYGKQEWRTGPSAGWAAGFLALSLLSALVSEAPALSLFFWGMQPLMYAALYVLVLTYVDTEEKQKQLFGVMLAGAVCVVLYGIFQFANIQSMASDIAAQDWVDPERFPLLYRRMYSTLENPNLCAGYLLMLIGLSGAAGLLESRRRRKWGLCAFTGVLVLCLLLTYSRGAWVSLGVMAAVLAMVYDRRIWFAFLAVPLVLLLYHGQITERFLSLFSGEDTSTLLRFALWESTEAMIADHPAAGVGWGLYYLAYPSYNFFIQNSETVIYHAHNMYLSVFAETGIPGGLCYFLFFLAHARLAVRLYRRGETSFIRAAGLGTVLAIAGMAAYGFGDYVLFGRALSFCFWAICALCAGCAENRSYEKPRQGIGFFYKQY